MGSRLRGRRPRSRVVAELEGLESRQLLYGTLGAHWVHASRITYSFAPDGTSVGGTPSAWYQRMDDLGIGEAVWKEQFRRAAAYWAAYCGANVVEVSDDGSAFSVTGNQQGDERFGDIRIAGVELAPGSLGMAFLPPPINGGTLAGDIAMNTAIPWNVNANYDIATVALHELGHALGLDHSTVELAAMYPTYTQVKQAPTSDDIAGIQAVYGPRPSDALEGPWGNNQYNRASNLTPFLDQDGVRLGGLDLNAGDTDWYYVTAPASTTGSMQIAVQSTELSSLSPRVVVYNSSLRLLASDSAAYSYGATVSATVPTTPGQTFLIRVMAANSGPSSVGGYGVRIGFAGVLPEPIEPPVTVVPETLNQGVIALEQSWIDATQARPYSSTQLADLRGVAEVFTTTPRHRRGDDLSVWSNGPRVQLMANTSAGADGSGLWFAPVIAMTQSESPWQLGNALAKQRGSSLLESMVDELLESWL